ncbi:DsbA family protein [Alisedimentitalea sp. MJ-SS2]|uniref:DsbA family protein n=1 Tax=Aliisedimentitalea sp. MJ-SS2 TaxID=3049795 RepID=UPI0029151E35|nr:DsbA family protein [Alisedimentitalea sp. MJ-SS2]MDU8929831.1 DsbA family protein [Alisedimentitalea sp. MJ-SS2]
MRNVFAWILAAILSFGAAIAQADELTKDDVKRLALEAILENPEIIMQAVDILQKREAEAEAATAQSVLSEQRDLLENDANAPVIGNPAGDVTIVEFFDYNCPYCKRAAPVIQNVIGDDTGVRVVYREWPILGEGSVFAARAALAARNQGKYEEFHWAMMEMKPKANEATVMQVARDLGLDLAKLKVDMEAPEVDDHIRISMMLASNLGFNGTPSFVIGDALAPGLVPEEEIKRLIAEIRADR